MFTAAPNRLDERYTTTPQATLRAPLATGHVFRRSQEVGAFWRVLLHRLVVVAMAGIDWRRLFITANSILQSARHRRLRLPSHVEVPVKLVNVLFWV